MRLRALALTLLAAATVVAGGAPAATAQQSTGTETVNIRNVGSGLCLDGAGGNVLVATCGGNSSQRWHVFHGDPILFQNAQTREFLAVTEAGTVTTQLPSGSPGQNWASIGSSQFVDGKIMNLRNGTSAGERGGFLTLETGPPTGHRLVVEQPVSSPFQRWDLTNRTGG